MNNLYSHRKNNVTQDGYHVIEVTSGDFISSYVAAGQIGDPIIDIVTLLKGELVTKLMVHIKADWTGSNFTDSLLNITSFDGIYDLQIGSLAGIADGVHSGTIFGPNDPIKCDSAPGIQSFDPGYLTQQTTNYLATPITLRACLLAMNGDPMTLESGTFVFHFWTIIPPTQTVN